MTGRVYFIADGDGRVKVGYSRDPSRRLRDLQVAHGAELVLIGTIPGTIQTERGVHAHLADAHLIGEWFRANDAVMAAIREILREPGIIVDQAQPCRGPKDPEQYDAWERLTNWLCERHPEDTASRVASETGINPSTVQQWLSRGSLPRGDQLLQLIFHYGPTFVRDGLAISGQWVADAVTFESRRAERLREIDEQIAALHVRRSLI